MKMVNETKKIMGDRSIRVCATTVRVPVYTGHSESVNIETQKKLTPDEVTHIIIMAELLDHALRRIDRRYSDVVRDSYFARLTHQEIADKRGLAIGSIGKYLERGLDALLEFVPERDKVLWWPQPNQSPL